MTDLETQHTEVVDAIVNLLAAAPMDLRDWPTRYLVAAVAAFTSASEREVHSVIGDLVAGKVIDQYQDRSGERRIILVRPRKH